MLGRIYIFNFNLNISDISAGGNFFKLSGSSIGVIRLKHEGKSAFELAETPTIQILKHPIVSGLAKYVDPLISKDASTKEYDPIVPLNLAKYFQDQGPFYAFRARGFEPGHPFFGSMDETVSSTLQPSSGRSLTVLVPSLVTHMVVLSPLGLPGASRRCIPPHVADRMHVIYSTDGMLDLSYLLGLMSRQDADDLAPVLRPLTRKEQLNAVWKLSPPERLLELQLALDHWVDIAGPFRHPSTLRKQGRCSDWDDPITLTINLAIQPATSTTIVSYLPTSIDSTVERIAAEETAMVPICFHVLRLVSEHSDITIIHCTRQIQPFRS